MATVLDEVSALAQVRNKRLFIEDRRSFDERIARLDERHQWEITVKRLRATRAIKLNAYYWGVVIHLLSEYTGFDPDEMHEWLKMRFIPKKLAVCDGNGEVKDQFVLGGSTRKMNNVEFSDYVEDIRRWSATDLGVVIPDPDPEWRRTAAREMDEAGYGAGV